MRAETVSSRPKKEEQKDNVNCTGNRTVFWQDLTRLAHFDTELSHPFRGIHRKPLTPKKRYLPTVTLNRLALVFLAYE